MRAFQRLARAAGASLASATTVRRVGAVAGAAAVAAGAWAASDGWIALPWPVAVTYAEAKRAPRHVSAAAVKELQQLLGDRLSLDEGEREHHGKDVSWHEGHPPHAVAYPRTTEEVSGIVKICSKHGVPIIPYGSGTSLEGHTTALVGGLCVDMSGMNKVLAVNVDDQDCVVEAGVPWQDLNEHLAPYGLFFPMDPGPNASIGGMVGTSCSGPNAVRYGTMKANVLGLKVVLPSGDVIKTANRARKSSAGYDLTRLFVGSEGTLGLVTEATLKLQRVPAASSVAVCDFPSVEAASRAVIALFKRGVVVGKVELLDAPMVKAINLHAGFSFPQRPHIFFEFTGTPATVEESAAITRGIAGEHGGGAFAYATDPEEKRRLWRARKEAFWAAGTLRPGSQVWTTDVCVPVSRLADCIHETAEDLARSSLIAPLVGPPRPAPPRPLLVAPGDILSRRAGHVGDGNFHLLVLLDPENPAELAEARRINGRLIRRAIAMDGTCTGEHGIGIGKMEFLAEELGPGAVDLMRTIKRAVDPKGIMNPGKIFTDN